MPYAVQIKPSDEAWDRAIGQMSEVLAEYQTSPDDLPPAEMAEFLRAMMKKLLAAHHRWLEAHGIAATILPDETNDSAYLFYFDREEDAALFGREWCGGRQSLEMNGSSSGSLLQSPVRHLG